MENDISGIKDDLGKSANSTPDPIKSGKRTVIDGKVHQWNGNDWVPVKEVKKEKV